MENISKMTRNEYRPEIDGLRAIAVGAVILYHAQITIFGYQPFKGGFIGVDIFFVISGYLITSIILKELLITGSFSFKFFYERRVRRILPVLLFVILASLPIAWMYSVPNSFIDFSKSIIYSLGFGSNFYFHYSGQEYAAESGLLKPFLHTWSLSVEEQFYIFFPIMIVITFRYFNKYLIYVLIFGFLFSLVLADWSSRNHSSISFYFLHTRMWELLAGSILSYFEITLGHRSKNKKLNLLLPFVGLILICHSILFFDNKIHHPSFFTLFPIIGVCFIIWYSDKDEIITKILSSKLFVGIGLISYSLYLWHYPIFAFARITEFIEGDIYKKLFLGLITIILSIISYYLIESPARNKRNKFKVILSLNITIIFILLLFNLSVVWKNGYKNRLTELSFNGFVLDVSPLYLNNIDGQGCLNNIEGCKFNTSSGKKVFAIGDSHMHSLVVNLKDRIVENQYQFINYTIDGCYYFPGFDKFVKNNHSRDPLCNDVFFQKLKKTLSKEKNSIIIFGGRLPLYLNGISFDKGREVGEWPYRFLSLGNYKTIQNSFKEEIFELSKNNKIILIYPIPEVGWHTVRVLSQWLKTKPSNDIKMKIISNSFEVYKSRTQSSFELLDSVQGENIFKVYPHELFCNTIIKKRCVANDDENNFYYDGDHVSLKGSELINDLIINEIEKLEFDTTPK